MVKVPPTDLNTAIGTSLRLDDPTVYVSGPQEDMRLSEGCMRRNLSAFLNPVGWPSHSPIFQSEVLDSVAAAMLAVVALPAVTETDDEATLYSVW